jgi:hypothetical protein
VDTQPNNTSKVTGLSNQNQNRASTGQKARQHSMCIGLPGKSTTRASHNSNSTRVKMNREVLILTEREGKNHRSGTVITMTGSNSKSLALGRIQSSTGLYQQAPGINSEHQASTSTTTEQLTRNPSFLGFHARKTTGRGTKEQPTVALSALHFAGNTTEPAKQGERRSRDRERQNRVGSGRSETRRRSPL